MPKSWKPTIVEGYEVSSHGDVRSYWRRGHNRTFPTPKELVPCLGNHGYPVVNMKGRVYCVHDLVCRAFHGDPEEGQEVAHKDGTRTNNHVDNLRWASRSENIKDSIKHGTWQVRTEHPRWGEGRPAR